jgi:hypothetical protein
MSISCNLPNAEDMRCIKLNDKMDMQRLTGSATAYLNVKEGPMKNVESSTTQGFTSVKLKC